MPRKVREEQNRDISCHAKTCERIPEHHIMLIQIIMQVLIHGDVLMRLQLEETQIVQIIVK